MAIGDASMEGRRPWVNLFYPLPDQVKRKRREIQDLISITAEMTGASCLARAVAPRAAAAVDHVDTELIGHRGWEGTGFLCGRKAASFEAAFCFYEGYNTTARVELSFRAQQSGAPKSPTAMLSALLAS